MGEWRAGWEGLRWWGGRSDGWEGCEQREENEVVSGGGEGECKCKLV